MREVPNLFKETTSLVKRTDEATTALNKYKNKIPVVVILSPDIKSRARYIKYILSEDLTSSYILMLVRKSVVIDSTKSIFLLTENKQLLNNSDINMKNLYETYKDADGYFYIHVHLENTFGVL
jgi:hypothetical protein